MVKNVDKTILFQYDHPLRVPQVFPRPDTLVIQENKIDVSGDQILSYGFLEGNARVNGKRVVYDPQSPVEPKAFSATGSQAEELVYVINIAEARKLAKSDDLTSIKRFFFEKENAAVLILKMGAKGALVSTFNGSEELI